MTTLPALVNSDPTSLVVVDAQCVAIEKWAEKCESVPELRDASNRLAAIDEYLTRTSTEGRDRVAATMRRLETRIGTLVGDAKPPANVSTPRAKGQFAPSSIANDDGLTRNERRDFRQMAKHSDVVEQVIAESTDEDPASRRKVLRVIRGSANERATPRSGPPMPPGMKRSPKQSASDLCRRAVSQLHNAVDLAESLAWLSLTGDEKSTLASDLRTVRTSVSRIIRLLEGGATCVDQ